ncbi:juvenile hormone epoxide hydrolase-like [Plodia interpunctella]|uniref:juvenile hormone epoxide hydrolase-like n=1 Tax=Plodia interpunctella TaxID=58824 RepID=UPI0023677C9A|nr:juvenile hormone epoxide hydrolase-like [Plodia interpunctella]
MSKKGSNKKQNERKTHHPASSSKSSSFFLTGKVFFLLSILSALASFYVYKILTTPPDLPALDLEQWWGPYPINQKRDLSIRPFEIEFSDIIVNDLRERLLHRRPFVPPLEDAGFTYGFNSNFLNKVLDYWQNNYNFKERERFLNQYNHFKTNIQGLDVHYIHVKPRTEISVKVIPLLMLHGWPGSVREFYDVIPLLTRLRHEYKFVFELIIPSLPGYGFSQAPVRPGFGPLEAATLLRNLMHRIGHKQYYIQGGDFGHVIGSVMATVFPGEVLGFHTNSPLLMAHPLVNIYTVLGSLWPRAVVAAELQPRMFPLRDHLAAALEETGYLHIQATKPDTIGLALTDSPSGLAAYILEKFSTWTDFDNKRAWDGRLIDKYSLNDLLDNVMVYWVSNSITTSMRLYAETFNKRNLALKMDMIPTSVPTWGIKFKTEIAYQPDSFLRLKYSSYLHSTVVEDGGHFAALENAAILSDDVFEAVDTFIQFHGVNNILQPETQGNPDTAESIYEFIVRDLQGNDVKLDKYRGKVVLIVNVASQCGLTDKNYLQLNELYDKYSEKGLRILAFPCNQFNGQEPGSHRQIFSFTKERGVQFDVFEKVDVNGANTHPLWAFLKRTQSGTFGDFIKWSFSKFVIDKSGVPVERFGPNVDPKDLEPELLKYL